VSRQQRPPGRDAARVRRLRPRGRAMRPLWSADQADRHRRTQHVPLPPLPACTACESWQVSEPYVHVPFDAQGRKRDWFCQDVLTGKAPIERVFEDDLVLAFHHPRPIAPFHVVIIPKKHTPSLLGPEALDPALL